MLAPAPYRAKDFCVVKKDGLYHVFYILHNTTLPNAQTERFFGHAVSPNLWDWTQLAPVIAAADTGWDSEHVWAPSIVERDGVYWMFYTGTQSVPGLYNTYQRIGVATSTDLVTWNRFDAPVFSCVQTPWAFCDPRSERLAFRDPFVMPDPADPTRWLMYYAASVPVDSSMVVGLARSDGDPMTWNDVKPLWNTYYSATGGYITESPHVFRYNGLWYLFFTTAAAQPLAFETALDPVADPAGWTWRGHLGDVLGFNTAAWYASEHFSDGLLDFFAFVEADRLAFYRMISNPGDWRFSLFQPDRFRVTSMWWNADSARVGQQVPLSLASVQWTGQSAAIETAELFPDGTERVIAPDSIGMPSQIPTLSDITTWTWTARALPDTGLFGGSMRLIVRLQDHTAAAAPIVVSRDTLVLADTLASSSPSPQTPWTAGTDEELIRPLRFALGPAVLVRMPRDAQARVAVYDLQGRRVRVLADRVLPRGANVLAWDGRTTDGARAGAGVYFVRIDSAALTGATRLVITP